MPECAHKQSVSNEMSTEVDRETNVSDTTEKRKERVSRNVLWESFNSQKTICSRLVAMLSPRNQLNELTTPFYDSRCHLDLLMSGCRRSFANYREHFANTFPSNFAGWIAVFCRPKLWVYKMVAVFNLLQADKQLGQESHSCIRCADRIPRVILYTEWQLQEMNSFSFHSCTASVLGIDKTYNLGPMHTIIVSVYKNTALYWHR